MSTSPTALDRETGPTVSDTNETQDRLLRSGDGSEARCGWLPSLGEGGVHGGVFRLGRYRVEVWRYDFWGRWTWAWNLYDAPSQRGWVTTGNARTRRGAVVAALLRTLRRPRAAVSL